MTSSGRNSEPSRKDADSAAATPWPRFKGPANWFTFRCPAHWQVRQKDTFLEICPRETVTDTAAASISPTEQLSGCHAGWNQLDPGTNVPALVLSAIWSDDGVDGALPIGSRSNVSGARPVFEDVALCFPDVMASRPEPPLSLECQTECWSGISRRPARGHWWQRFWRRRPVFHWWFWKIRRGNLQLVVTLQSQPGIGLRSEQLDVCRHILNSLELAAQPAFPPEVFRRAVVTLASRRFPLLKISASGPFELRIEDSEISLGNFYRCYLQQPHRLEQIVLPGIAAVVRMRELGPDQLVPTLRQARNRIFPMLAAADARDDECLPAVPWVAGLAVRFVLDDDDAYRFVNHAVMNSWKLSLAQLQDIAMQNLRRLLQRKSAVKLVHSELTGHVRMLAPTRPDAYNCAWLLDPEFQASLRESLGPQLIVGVPNRDFFVAVSMEDTSILPQLRRRVDADFETMHHPLSKRLLVVSADGVSEYCSD